MSRRRTNQELRDAIVARAKAGEAVRDIAASIGLSLAHCYKVLQSAGRRRRYRREIDPLVRVQIVRQIQAMQTFASIASYHHVTAYAVQQIAREEGINGNALRSRRARERAAQSAAQKRGWQEAREMSASRAEVFLNHAVAMECAMPWVRHPQPTR